MKLKLTYVNTDSNGNVRVKHTVSVSKIFNSLESVLFCGCNLWLFPFVVPWSRSMRHKHGLINYTNTEEKCHLKKLTCNDYY